MTPVWLALGAGVGWLLLTGKKPSEQATTTVRTTTPRANATVQVRIPGSEQSQTVDLSLLNDAESEVLATGSADDIYAEAIGSNHPAFISAAAARLAAMGDSRAIALVSGLVTGEQ